MEGILKSINNKVKHKINILLNTIVPSKIPEFSIHNTDEAIFFIYLSDNQVHFVSHNNNENGDEIIKVGRANNEFTFYPIKKDSIFFEENSGLKTFQFIEAIVNNKINIIANKIYNDMIFLLDKITEYKTLYINKLNDMKINLNIIDKTNITYTNEELYSKLNNKISQELQNLAKTNIRDSLINIFKTMYPDGIYDIESFITQKSSLNADMLKNYYNQSNLSNPNLIEKTNITINNQELEINYIIKEMRLKCTSKKQLYADSEVIVDFINGIDVQPDEIFYSNNEIRVNINKGSFSIHNNTDNNIYINNIKNIFYINEAIDPFIQAINSNIKIDANMEINIKMNYNKKDVAISNLTTDNIHKYIIIHSIKITYTIDSTTKNLVGKSQYKLYNILSL